MEPAIEAFRWTDQDEAFFGLSVRANDVIVEDGMIIWIFEEFFLSFSPNNSLIRWTEYFEIVALIHMFVVVVHLTLMPKDVRLQFLLDFSLILRTTIRLWP